MSSGEWEQIKKSRSFQKSECNISLSSLKEVCRLGQGAFGTVFLVEDSSHSYALKRVSKGHAARCGTCESLCWERDLLNMLDSNFLVRLYRTMKDGKRTLFPYLNLFVSYFFNISSFTSIFFLASFVPGQAVCLLPAGGRLGRRPLWPLQHAPRDLFARRAPRRHVGLLRGLRHGRPGASAREEDHLSRSQA